MTYTFYFIHYLKNYLHLFYPHIIIIFIVIAIDDGKLHRQTFICVCNILTYIHQINILNIFTSFLLHNAYTHIHHIDEIAILTKNVAIYTCIQQILAIHHIHSQLLRCHTYKLLNVHVQRPSDRQHIAYETSSRNKVSK